MNPSEMCDLSSLPVDLFNNVGNSEAVCSASQACYAPFSELNEFVEDLVELDAHELETMLANPFDALASSESFSHGLSNTSHQFQPSMEMALNTENQPQFVSDNQQRNNVENTNILMISIPKEMQDSSTFDSLPTISLDSKTVNNIRSVSSGHSGAFVLLSNDRDSRPNIIRRPPLQVIQRISQQTVQQSPPREVRSSKRKQSFQLTRDDSLFFTGDSPPEQAKIRPDHGQDSFKYAVNDDKVAKIIATTVDQDPNKCPGCKKVFKKLSVHKCKKALVPVVDQPVADDAFKCSVCGETFALQVDFCQHQKSHKKMFCARCEKSFHHFKDLKLHLETCVAETMIVTQDVVKEAEKVFEKPDAVAIKKKKVSKVVTKKLIQVVKQLESQVVDDNSLKVEKQEAVVKIESKVAEKDVPKITKQPVEKKKKRRFVAEVDKSTSSGEQAEKKMKRQNVEEADKEDSAPMKHKMRAADKKKVPPRARVGTRSITKL